MKLIMNNNLTEFNITQEIRKEEEYKRNEYKNMKIISIKKRKNQKSNKSRIASMKWCGDHNLYLLTHLTI